MHELYLRPGTAAADSATACIARSKTNPPPGATTPLADNADTLLRKQVQLYRVNVTGPGGSGGFIECFLLGGNFYRRSDGTLVGMQGASNLNAQALSPVQYDYALVYVSDDGTIGQVYPVGSTASGTAIATSCWTSLAVKPTITP